MKCAFSLLILLELVFHVARTGLAEAPKFRAGAAAVDITPTDFPVIINGGFLERTADQAHDRLMSRALVLDDGSTRVAMVVVDNLMMERELIDEAKRMASQATDIPSERMLVSATHTHSAPSVMACLGSRADPKYGATLPGHIARSIVLADQSLQPARVGWTVVKAYALNHCRRWIFRPDRIGQDPFGESNVRAMMHPGHQSPNHIGPAGPADPDLSMLSVQSIEGKPIAVLANLAVHYKGSTAVSADFCGHFGEVFAAMIGAGETERPFVGIMSQGTSGDSMWMDYARPRNDPGLEGYTQAVARLAAEAYGGISYRDHVSLAAAERLVRIGRRLPDPQRLAAAREVASKLETEDRLPRDRPEVYAMEAIYLHEKRELELKLQAIRIGDLGITAIPNEVYGITGLKLKTQSPLNPTFNIELANGAAGYIPPPEQHALGGYTTWPARTAGLDVEAEPRIVETLLQLLEEVSGKKRKGCTPPADAYVDAVLGSAPQAFWRMDEIAGWTAEDATGGQHMGHYEPGVAYYLRGRSPSDLEYAEQTSNRAVHFAGGRMIAETGETGERYSVELWLWNGLPIDARETTGYVYSIGDSADDSIAGDRLSLTGAADGGVLRFENGDGVELAGKTPLNLRTWHHVAVVRDGRRIAVYLNGNPAPEIEGEAAMRVFERSRWCFGGRHDRQATWEGKLDDIALYDRSLAETEIATHYRASGLTPPKPVPPPRAAAVHAVRPHVAEDLARYAEAVARSAPIAWWTLHDASKGRVPDGSAKNHPGTLEERATVRRPGSDSPNFTGGRMKAQIQGWGPDYSVAIWYWNELPVTSRPVTGYFFSRGPDGSKEAIGEHLGIGGTHAATGRLIVFNGNQRDELLEGRTMLPLRSWNFVVLTRHGDRVRVYLNGDLEPDIDGRLPATFPPAEEQLFVGGRNDRFAPFQGRIDQVSVYDLVLTPEQASELWKASRVVP